MILFRSTGQAFLTPAVVLLWNAIGIYLNISFLCFGIVLQIARFETESDHD